VRLYKIGQKSTDLPSGCLRKVTMETVILEDREHTQYIIFKKKGQTHWRVHQFIHGVKSA